MPRSAAARVSGDRAGGWWLQYLTYLLPARHFVSISQVIVYRGGGLGAAWRQFLMVGTIGLGFFVYSPALFRKSIAIT